jgi:2'-5' RNA ligase
MADATRTFVGLPVPSDFRLKLERLTANLAKSIPGTRWTHPEDHHLTLAFLGDIPHADLREICRATAEAASKTKRFELGLQGIGAFPTLDRPRVIWAGVTGDLDALRELRDSIVDCVTRSGYAPDDLRFHPHVTLGRPTRASGAFDLAPVEAHLRTWTAGPWTVDTVVAYASHHSGRGPAYTPLGTARLG